MDVVVGLKDGSKSTPKAEEQGLTVKPVAEAAKEADVIMILVPDQHQEAVYRDEIAPHLEAGNVLLFSHGFNIRFGFIQPPENVDVAMVAPKARAMWSAASMRQAAACPPDRRGAEPLRQAKEIALAYAKGIGGTRAGVIETTFTEETETDLFGEQAVLCGGASQLVQYGFETLTEAGYKPEIAYFEVLHELKLIVDLMVEGGLTKQRWSISDTAEFGDYVSGPRVISPEVKENMKAVLADIQSGAFAQRFMEDQRNGGQEFQQLRKKNESHPIESTGRELRKLFSWINDQEDDYTEGTAAR